MKPVSLITVTAPNDTNGNSRKAYILVGWNESNGRCTTTIVKDQGQGLRECVASHTSQDPYMLPSVSIKISAREFKRLFKEGV